MFRETRASEGALSYKGTLECENEAVVYPAMS